jgi:hypothetical protein
MLDELDEQPQKRQPGTLAAAVAAQVTEQREAQALDAAWTAGEEEPSFDKRSGTSNFGKRLASKIQIAAQ